MFDRSRIAKSACRNQPSFFHSWTTNPSDAEFNCFGWRRVRERFTVGRADKHSCSR